MSADIPRPDLELDLRHYPRPTRLGMREAEVQPATVRWRMPADSVALVLVDVWHDLYMASFMTRAAEITRTKIKPLVEAFRRIGAPVIHAPAPHVSKKYERFVPKMSEAEVWGPKEPEADWPPADFRAKRGAYAEWAPKEVPAPGMDEFYDALRIAPEVEPAGEDLVIHTGRQLHAVLRERKILRLFYVGFATNVCMYNRDYATRAMKVRGYDVIVVRDATTGIEVADTAGGLELTEAFLTNMERLIGYTTTTTELLAACGK